MAYLIRVRYGDPTIFGGGADPPWCFDRLGMSYTRLEDGRSVLVAGEHEDGSDPDFRIFNDVIVIHPDGGIQVFGYPASDFEPTDFHSATLVGDNIWIIGGLGYVRRRSGPIPVYRLNVTTFEIQKIETTGDVPTRIYDHVARLVGNQIEISSGKNIFFRKKEEIHRRNWGIFTLDLHTLVWTCDHQV
jgi:hypothetical protein